MKTEEFSDYKPVPAYVLPLLWALFIMSWLFIWLVIVPAHYVQQMVARFFQKQARRVAQEMGPFPLDIRIIGPGTVRLEPNQHAARKDQSRSHEALSGLQDRLVEASCVGEELFLMAIDSFIGSFAQFFQILVQDTRDFFRHRWHGAMILLGMVLAMLQHAAIVMITPDQGLVFVLCEALVCFSVSAAIVWQMETIDTLRPEQAALFDIVIGKESDYETQKEYIKEISKVNSLFIRILFTGLFVFSIALVLGILFAAIGVTDYLILLALKMTCGAVAGLLFSYIENKTRPRRED